MINFSTLQGLTIPEGVVTQISVGGNVMWTSQNVNSLYSVKLVERTITNYSSDTLETIGHSAFRCCTSLTSVDFPNATSVDSNAFDSCTALTSANLPSVTSIGSSAFKGCKTLTSVNFPNATSMGGSAFNTCSGLINVNLPSVTSIGNSAFYVCSKLPNIDLPKVTSIGTRAFQLCSKLTTLILRSETICTLSSTNAFSSTPIKSGTGYIYVPSALLSEYQAATNWSTYSAQFRAIEDYPDICG